MGEIQYDWNTSTKNRNIYLNKLIGFQDTEPVKIITGVRRYGKSSLLKLMVKHLGEIRSLNLTDWLLSE